MAQALDMVELQELKTQFNLINEKLEKQLIINENLIKESMSKNISYIEKYYKRYLLCYMVITPTIIAYMLLIGVHWGLFVFVLLALLVEFMLYYNGYRTLNPKTLMVKSYIDALECVSVFKKRFEMITRIMFIPAVLIVVLLVSHISGYTWDIGRIIFYSLFVLAAWIFEFVRKRKMFAGLDEVLKQIKELRKEPQC
ncbi:MAG: hypothetical protein IJ328_03895 [Muribaculaceae bacterium]|nr:hypothetical protein [Muribaculaceae bacterium]